MSDMKVKFYGEHDMSAGWHLKKAESIPENWNGSTNITDFITPICTQQTSYPLDQHPSYH